MRRRTKDGGYTLTEIVITIALMGIVVTGILTAVQTSIRASSVAYDNGQLETALLNTADRIHRAPQKCNYDQYAGAAARASGWNESDIWLSVEILDYATDGSGAYIRDSEGNLVRDWIPQPCPSGVFAFDVQRVTITGRSQTRDIVRSLTIVKSSVG